MHSLLLPCSHTICRTPRFSQFFLLSLPFFLSAPLHFDSYNLTSLVSYDKLACSLVQRGQIPEASFAPWKAGPLDMVAAGACSVTVLILLLHILLHSSLILIYHIMHVYVIIVCRIFRSITSQYYQGRIYSYNSPDAFYNICYSLYFVFNNIKILNINEHYIFFTYILYVIFLYSCKK